MKADANVWPWKDKSIAVADRFRLLAIPPTANRAIWGTDYSGQEAVLF